MRYLRVIHPKHFDPEGKRINDLAFTISRDKSGISVVDTECVEQANNSICDHLRRFYPDPIGGNPLVFWRIPDDPLFAECNWEPSLSSTGDECHRNLKGISNNKAHKFFNRQPLSSFTVCDGQNERPLQESDLQIS